MIDFTPSWACLGAQTCFINISTIASGSFTGFYWNFSEPVSGSLDTSSLQNPCYVFSSLNPVDVTVILTSDKGCKDTLQRSIVVSSVPTASFNSTVVCPGITTCFSDLSTIPAGSIVDWQWDFSDAASGPADSSSLQNPCHVFLNTSPNVTLTVTSNIGCQNTITIPVSFNPEPASDFSATNSCFGNQTCFTNLTSISSGNIVSHQWDFGEPSSGTANLSVSQNPCHTYSAANSFDVSLTTISDNGCQNNITHAVSVSPLPVADFSTSKTCLGNQTCFTDLSGIPSGSISSYNWNFNDAGSGGLNSSSQANPCHLFSSLSPYNVTLILTSDKGCNDTVTSSVIVSPVPVTNFSSTIECPGNTTCFSDLSSIASGNITNWEWNFSDSSSGSSDSSNSQNPCHTFMNRSSPNVSLIVTSDSGCNNTVVLPMTFNPVPVVDFNATTACFGNQTCFTNLSSLSSGTISTIQWDFGDSITVGLNYSSLQSPCHSFSSANAFTVSLDIMSDMGCQSNVIKPVSVSPLPVANFSASKTCLGNQTCFTDLSGIPSGSISSYNWNFNDAGSGGLNSSSQANPCHLFSSLSPYNVTLILTSDKGCNDTVTSSVIVSPVPVTNFSSTIECPGNTTCFSDLSSIASGNITNWEWNFSDSSSGSSDSSNTQNPCHTFLNTSSPNVSLIVTSDSGCQNQFRSMVSFNPFAVPDFSSTTTCLGSQTCFNDLSTISSGTIASHQWNFGELNSGSADTSTVQSPCHIFSTASVYNVSLSLTTDLGCESFISQAVSVSPLPVADFISEATCLTKYSSFFDRSSFQNNDTIITWEWNFGDASPNDYRQSPVHTFNSLNTFNVSLITTTIMGCKDTINKQITVHTGPVANFTSPQQDCSPVCENFIDLSQAIDGSITQWHWDFPGGNPNTSLQQNPVICYDNAGTFPVTLIVMNSYGCRDTSYVPQYLTVHPQPVADFYLIREPENLFAPELELGHLWSNDVVKWYWDFGDSSSVDSVNQDPVHTYIYSVLNNNYYNFNIMLEVKNQFGCVAKLNREINIQPLFSFFIPNTFTPNAESPNDLYFGKGRGILEYKIVIFDRWGIAIWECESKGDYREWDKDNGNGMPAACQWDGIYQGRSVQEDVYVWKVELKNIFGDRFNYIGHVNVVR